MMKRSIACAISIALSGCETLKTASPPDSLSGWQNVGTKVELAKGTIKDPWEKKDDTATTDPAYHALFEPGGMCGPPSLPRRDGPQLPGPVIATIIITVVTSAISYWSARQQRALDKRADASKRSSDAQLVMSPDQFQSGKCVVFTRRAQDPRSVASAEIGKAQDNDRHDRQDLVIVMRVDRWKAGKDEIGLPDHFSLTPIFARAYNSISQTKNGGDIALAVGITLHQIATVQGVPTLANLGVAATAIQALPLTGIPQCVKPAPCHASSILPLPTDGGTIVLGIGVQEAGDLGFEVDLAKAQVDAIAAALGPLSGTLLQGHFARERVRDEK